MSQPNRAGTDPPEGLHTSTTRPTRLQTNVTVHASLLTCAYVSSTDTARNDTLPYTILTNPDHTQVHTMDAIVPSAKLQTWLHVRSRSRYPVSSCFVDPQRQRWLAYALRLLDSTLRNLLRPRRDKKFAGVNGIIHAVRIFVALSTQRFVSLSRRNCFQRRKSRRALPWEIQRAHLTAEPALAIIEHAQSGKGGC